MLLLKNISYIRNNIFSPEDANRAALRKLGSPKLNQEDFLVTYA